MGRRIALVLVMVLAVSGLAGCFNPEIFGAIDKMIAAKSYTVSGTVGWTGSSTGGPYWYDDTTQADFTLKHQVTGERTGSVQLDFSANYEVRDNSGYDTTSHTVSTVWLDYDLQDEAEACVLLVVKNPTFREFGKDYTYLDLTKFFDYSDMVEILTTLMDPNAILREGGNVAWAKAGNKYTAKFENNSLFFTLSRVILAAVEQLEVTYPTSAPYFATSLLSLLRYASDDFTTPDVVLTSVPEVTVELDGSGNLKSCQANAASERSWEVRPFYWDIVENLEQYPYFTLDEFGNICFGEEIVLYREDVPEAYMATRSVDVDFAAEFSGFGSTEISIPQVDRKNAVDMQVLDLYHDIVIVLDGEILMPPYDSRPFLFNDRTMLPARFLVESLGGTASYGFDEEGVVFARLTVNGRTIEMKNEATTAFVNGAPHVLDAPATLVNDRFFLPVRFVCEALGMSVDYDTLGTKMVVYLDF